MGNSPYSFQRQADGPGRIIRAAHINELQQAVEELGALERFAVASGEYMLANAFRAAISTGNIAANFLHLQPFWTGPDGVAVDRIGINVINGAAGNARLGVYTADPESGRPNELIDDLGTVSVATSGLKEITIDKTYIGVSPLNMVWLGYVSDVTAQLSTLTRSYSLTPFGLDSTLAQRVAVYDAHTYGALPATATVDGYANPGVLMFYRKA